MANVTTFSAELRERAGKGAARATRRGGRVPAVIYGDKQKSVMISLDPGDLMQQLRGPGFFSHVFEISVNGDKHRVLARDLQLHPVSERPLHVDFMRFGADTKVNVDVQVIFENEEESPGLKRGGVLNVVRHAIEFVCPADRIPESITVDLTGLEIGDSVHISDISLPDDAEPTISDRDFTVATIAAPSVLKTPEEEAAEAAEAEALLLEGEEGEIVEGEEGATPEGEEGKGEADAESKD